MYAKKMRGILNSAFLSATVLFGLTRAGGCATLPDVVNEPQTLDLGATSFYDGFARNTPGFAFLDFARVNDSTSISGANGGENPTFNKPHITAVTNIFQGIWISPVAIFGGHLGATMLLSIASLSSSFGSNSRVLTTNNFNVGDLVFGPVYQGDPIFLGKRPVFSQRFVFSVFAPTGAFNHSVNLNQSSGYWSINPYWAATVLPLPSLEISTRVNYLYNFQTTNFGNPPTIPHVKFDDAQAGQAVYVDFATSQAITKLIGLGVNGYYFDQLSNDRVNGENIPQSRKSELYFGPGINVRFSKTTFLNANLYLPLATVNEPNGPQFNLQFVHVF